uniref:LOB domain-containing protein n=1 Tax=Kalanchoe fedtschenkoi TaxID=63787 RepID=A0A7N0TL15_KALFE
MTGLGSSCGACKFLRRKCATECIFAPYFCYDQAAVHFSAVHRVFGASNFSKLLLHLPMHSRSVAAMTVSYEALARMHDPIYGCVAHVLLLQQQVVQLEKEIEMLEKQMAMAWFDISGAAAAPSSTQSANIDFYGLQVETTELDMDVRGYSTAQQTSSQLLTASANAAAIDQRSREEKSWFLSPDPMGQESFMHCYAESFAETLNTQVI